MCRLGPRRNTLPFNLRAKPGLYPFAVIGRLSISSSSKKVPAAHTGAPDLQKRRRRPKENPPLSQPIASPEAGLNEKLGNYPGTMAREMLSQ